MQKTKVIFQNALTVALFLFIAALSACSKGSVVSDSTPQQPAPQQPAAQQPANKQADAAQADAAQPAGAQAQQPTPSPTLHPLMKQAQAQPGVPVSVPDAVRRPLNAEEMKKALEAMPPEVRARIQGMAVAPQGAKPQSTPTPKNKMTSSEAPVSSSNTEIYESPQELAWAAALRFASLAEQFVVEQGKFTVALSGGSTPKAMLSLLAGKPFADSLPWKSIYFFWGDERCVPPDHADSNFRMATEALLSKVGVPQQNVFRVPAEDENHASAASLYSATIRQFFNTDQPQFDLIFLGMGADGHTASLFPGTQALQVTDQIVAANFVEKLNSWRITLTAHTVNQARNIIFLIAGADKAPALKEVLEGERQPETYPSQLIHPTTGTLLWMLDEAAASLLTNSDNEEPSVS